MGQIQGIVLPDNIGAALGGTPEEAAKIFLKAASKGLAQVMADAIAQAVGESVGDGGGAPPDWTKLVKGCAVKLDWETPPNTPVQTVIAFANVDPALGGIGFSVGISGSF
jgi:hypothetical protein